MYPSVQVTSTSMNIGLLVEHPDIERILFDAIETLYATDIEILKLDAAERTICAQLASILRRRFDQHAVHVEYNRHGIEPKGIELPNAAGVLTTKLVSPDIVVHQPGHDDENILVIEVKKTTNPTPDEPDLVKLTLIKEQIHYRFAAFLRLPAGPAANSQDVRIEWV
jgi:hypothetical protein